MWTRLIEEGVVPQPSTSTTLGANAHRGRSKFASCPGQSLAAMCLGLFAFAGAAQAQTMQPGRVWTHSSATAGWIPHSVALGNHGSQAVMSADGFEGFSRSIHCGVDDPAAAFWSSSSPVFWRGTRIVSFDDDRNVDSKICQATLECLHSDYFTPWTPRVRIFHANGTQAGASYTFPMSAAAAVAPSTGLTAAKDGNTIAAAVFDPQVNQIRLAVFKDRSPQPTATFLLSSFGPISSMVGSADGSTVVVVSTTFTFVVDTRGAGSVTTLGNFGGTTGAAAVSGNGDTLVRTNLAGDVSIYRRSGSTYDFVASRGSSSPDVGCRHLALSEDGRWLASGWNHSPSYLQIHLEVWDLQGSTITPVFQDQRTASGSFTNTVKDVDISSDGQFVAVGLSGDGTGLSPEVLGYQRNLGTGQWSNVLAHNLPGSVQDLDISPDGRGLVVGSKSVHDNILGGGGRTDYFNMTVRDGVLGGRPQIGQTVTLRFQVTPGSPVTIFRNERYAPNPTSFGSIGQLKLRRVGMDIHWTGTADGTGLVEVPVVLEAAQAGRTIHFQAFATSPRRLSEDTVTITVPAAQN